MIIANGGREFDEVSVKQAQLAQFRDLDGVTRNISHWEGAYRIVNFWATWCPPCREEIPLFVDLQAEFQSINVTFIGIAVDDVERVRTFVAGKWC
jgi:thiol-disulfide isomerase/thioredoxin